MLAFCSNDYLGLASHPARGRGACAKAPRCYGAGSGASHLISGHSRAHTRWKTSWPHGSAPHPGRRARCSFCTGYMANLAMLTALGDDAMPRSSPRR